MMRLFSVAMVLGSLVCLGCGSGSPNLGEVTGTVTLDEKPLANVLVTFTPEGGGRASTGTTDEAGKYTLGFGAEPGALIGTHKVSVMSLGTAKEDIDTEMASDSTSYEDMAMGKGGGAAMYDNADVAEKIPARYNTATELKFEVKSGSNTYDIPMTSK